MLRYITSIKRIREQKIRAHLWYGTVLFTLKLSLGFGVDFEFGLELTIGLELQARVRVWVRFMTRITIFLFLHNVTAAFAFCFIWFSFFLGSVLLHRPGFQHLITAAPAAAVVFFCCSIHYLSGWHRCPNPNSNNKILEKKKDFEAI